MQRVLKQQVKSLQGKLTSLREDYSQVVDTLVGLSNDVADLHCINMELAKSK